MADENIYSFVLNQNYITLFCLFNFISIAAPRRLLRVLKFILVTAAPQRDKQECTLTPANNVGFPGGLVCTSLGCRGAPGHQEGTHTHPAAAVNRCSASIWPTVSAVTTSYVRQGHKAEPEHMYTVANTWPYWVEVGESHLYLCAGIRYFYMPYRFRLLFWRIKRNVSLKKKKVQ